MPGKPTSLILIALGLAALVGCGSSPSSSTSPPSFPNSHTAYVALPTSNAVGGYKINNTTASFATILGSPYPGGTSPASVVVHPSNRFVYAANQGGNNISLFNVDSTLGSLLEVLPRTPAGLTPAFLTMDSGGNFLYVVNRVSSSISVYSIDSGSGALTAVSGSPFPTFRDPIALALAPSGKFLYVLNGNVGAVFAYTVAAGVLQAVAGPPALVGNGPVAITVDPAEPFVYVANAVDSTVSVLSINSGTGALSIVGTYATGTQPTSLAVLGQFLYVANQGSSNVSVFSVDPTTGVLAQITGSPFAAGSSPLFEVLDPNNLFLYIGSQEARTITALSIDATTGALTTTAESTSTGVSPASMSVSK